MLRFSIAILCFLLCFSDAKADFVKHRNESASAPLALVRGKVKKRGSRTGARTRKKQASRTGARAGATTVNSDWEKVIRTGASGVVVYPNSILNPIEKAQLLAGHTDDEIRLALAVRLLELWTDEELQAELAARAARIKRE